MCFRGNVLYLLMILGAKLRPSTASVEGPMGWVGLWVEERRPSCVSASMVSHVARILPAI